MMACDDVRRRAREAGRVWLFLDYDGTLADFAPTPEHVEPDPALVELVAELAAHSRLRVAVVSGRCLAHVETLLPGPGILRAGTYGVELRLPAGERVDRVPYAAVRPVLEHLKPRWQALLEGREGFFLEDKDWALALHARFASAEEAEAVLARAGRMASEAIDPETCRVLGGHKFLEVGPCLAHKGRTIAYLLDRYPWPGALPLYLGDDDKDEEAFGVILEHGGAAIVVSAEPRPTQADCRLTSPQEARRWLQELLRALPDDASAPRPWRPTPPGSPTS
jgi:trehalose-phosphatase